MKTIKTSNDPEAFRILYERHHRRILALCQSILRGNEDAVEDAAQDAFFAAYCKIDSFRGDADFSSWLYRIAVNVALNYRRQSKRRREAAIEDVIADAAEHGAPLPLQFGKRDRALERFPERKLLRDALQQLTHDHEQIIYLHDFLGFHYKEISAIIGCSAGLCKGRHFNAVKNLKRLLGTQK